MASKLLRLSRRKSLRSVVLLLLLLLLTIYKSRLRIRKKFLLLKLLRSRVTPLTQLYRELRLGIKRHEIVFLV